MLRQLILYLRSCFCEHDWQHLKSIDLYESEFSQKPNGHKEIYRCKKCGYVQKIKY